VVDWYAVAVIKDSGGHVPQKNLTLCSTFIEQGSGDITYIVMGSRRYSSDLVQGSLEIPCTYIFCGKEKLVHNINSNETEEAAF